MEADIYAEFIKHFNSKVDSSRARGRFVMATSEDRSSTERGRLRVNASV